MSSANDPVRASIRALDYSGITKIALEGLGRDDVTPLWFGESELPTPSFIKDAAKRALDQNHTFYTYARGSAPLRAAIERYLTKLYGKAIDPNRITVPGSTMLACMMAGQCLLEPGAEMVAIAPFWPNIRNVAQACGATTREVALDVVDGRFALDLDKLEDAVGPATRAIYVNSPSNPTGWIASSGEFAAILALARRRGLGVISDEVYHRNVFSGRDPAPSMLEIAEPDEPVFVVNGFSKAWAMTGWRLGWMVAPANLVEPMAVLSECANTGATVFAQAGGIAALEEGEAFLAWFRERCRRNRDLVAERLGGLDGVALPEPEGAFYAFPKIEGVDGLAFARAALREEAVGVAAGYTFGQGFENHVRICFAIDEARFEAAIDRLVALIGRRR